MLPEKETPLYETVWEWTKKMLRGSGAPVPLGKRLAVLVTGLVAGERATSSQWASTVAGLKVTPAKEESLVRRLERILGDARLDPEKLLPTVFRNGLPEVLAEQIAAQEGADATPGRTDPQSGLPLRLVIDESSKEDQVHLLLVGLIYQGIALPLGVRCWKQQTKLPEEEYWWHLGSLLWEVHGVLPPVLRDQVVVVADRGYGYPRWIDLIQSLKWSFVVRTPDQTRIDLGTGKVRALRELVREPGGFWRGGFTPRPDPESAPVSDPEHPIAVFKKAGWRLCRVVVAWALGQPSPWLLLTNLPPDHAHVQEYAQRWAIERLFLSWKSHGWDLESSGIHDPARLGRLLTGLILATWWRVALALPECLDHLSDLSDRAARRSAPASLPADPADSPQQASASTRFDPAPSPLPHQLSFSWSDHDFASTPPAPPHVEKPPSRPWPAKFSLLTWGLKVARNASFRSTTPRLCWALPPTRTSLWSSECALALAGAA